MKKLMGNRPNVRQISLWVMIVALAMQAASLTEAGSSGNQFNAEKGIRTAQADSSHLEIGKSIERELRGGQAHAYEITLEANQYLRTVVEQHGIDLIVLVIDPDGLPLTEVDSPNGAQGPELVDFLAEKPGNYRLMIRPSDKDAAAGRYEIRVAELRQATQQDRQMEEARRLNAQILRLNEQGKYQEAIPLAERALALRERALGAEHPDLDVALNNLASLYESLGNYAKAESLHKRNLTILERARGVDHPDLADTLNNLASLFEAKGDYSGAEPLYKRALAIREKVLSPSHPDMAVSFNNLATLYYHKGEYAEAINFFQRALTIFEKLLGPMHPNVGTLLNNLGQIYVENSDYVQAESLYLRALAIREKALGASHPDIANVLNDLALLYFHKGDYAKAELFSQRAVAIFEKALGAEHILVATALDNLAGIYGQTGQYAKAEPLHLRGLAIREKALGAVHPDIASSINSLATLYYQMKDYAKAEQFYLRALAMREKILGLEHPDLGSTINNLATLYADKGEPVKAEALYKRALSLYEMRLGPQHPLIAATLNNLVLLYEQVGDVPKALDALSRAADIRERDFVRNLITGSERQKLGYLRQFEQETDFAIYSHVALAPENQEALRIAIESVLRRRGRGLEAAADTIAVIRRHTSLQGLIIFNQLARLRSQIAALTLRGPSREGLEIYRQQLKALYEQVDNLEAELSSRSAEFRTQFTPVTLARVQKEIPPHAALVEFATYRPYNPQKKVLDRLRYIAYVLYNQGEPRWVELGDAGAINRKVQALRQALRDKNSQTVKQLARRVDQDVMQPVRQLLGGTQRVFLSPDGSLNLLPFAALVDEQNRYLVERYSFTYLTSGRDLLRLKEGFRDNGAVIIIADPDFGEANTSSISTMASTASESALPSLYFGRLTQTEREANELKKLFPKAEVLTREKATETVLKQVNSPQILHIATHGFFLDDGAQLQKQVIGQRTLLIVHRRRSESEKREAGPSEEINPLLRSGLGLAGANTGNGGDGNDGILTALEAISLNLWGTKLVVLSACDTGVGEATNGNGVYGLRRALTLAGSESQLMSLWPVSDQGTNDLMIAYYRKLRAGIGRSEALRQVQLSMLNSPKRQHPFYWASFIQSGEWANLDGKRID